MTLRVIFGAVFLLIMQISWHANGQVKGTVKDQSGQPLAFATVQLLSERDSAMVAGVLTDDEGSFLVPHNSGGRFFVVISSIGFKTLRTSTFDKTVSTLVDIGTLRMDENSLQIEAVEITAERAAIQQLPDVSIVNVDASLMSKGGSALQVLERAPGITVDRQNNVISLNGKGGVLVSVNGKPMRVPIEQVMALLNGMSANDIEKIELLASPPSRYDADGAAGLINIVMKKPDANGVNGSLSASAGYGYREKGTVSANVNRAKGNNNLYASYSFFHDRNIGYFHAVGTEEEPLLGGHARSDFLSTTTPNQNNHNASLGIDHQFGKGTTVEATANYSNMRTAVETINTGTYAIDPDSLYLFNAISNGVNHWKSIRSGLSIGQQLGDGHQINLEGDYLRYKNDFPTEAQNTFLSSNGYPAGSNDTLFSPVALSHSKTLIQIGSAKADYLGRAGSRTTFEAGVKGTYTLVQSASIIQHLLEGEYVTRPQSSGSLTMQEYIGAAYTSLQTTFDSAWHISVGARYEYSDTHIRNTVDASTITHRRLSLLFPNIVISKNIGRDALVSIAWSKRISRPSYLDLASFVTYNGPMSVNSGNPFLLPTITNNLKLDVQFRGYLLSVLASHDEAPIARYQIVYTPDRKQMSVSPQNMVYQKNLTFRFDVPLNLATWWEFNTGFVGGWRKFKITHTQEPAEKLYFGYSITGMHRFHLPAGFDIEISGYYNGMSYNGSRKTDGYGVLNAGIRKSLAGNRGTFQLTVSDLLRTNVISSYFGALTREAFDLTTHVRYHNESSDYLLIQLSFTRSFGSGTRTQRVSESTQSERDRIN